MFFKILEAIINLEFGFTQDNEPRFGPSSLRCDRYDLAKNILFTFIINNIYLLHNFKKKISPLKINKRGEVGPRVQ